MDIGNVNPASIGQTGYVDPTSQQQVFQALGGEKNPMAVRAFQIANNQDQASSRETIPGSPLMDMVHKLNPNWREFLHYNTIAGINQNMTSGKGVINLRALCAVQAIWQMRGARPTFCLILELAANTWFNRLWGNFDAPGLRG